MKAAIATLNYEMAEARRNIDWLGREIEAMHEKRRKEYQKYYQKKAELKALNDKANV